MPADSPRRAALAFRAHSGWAVMVALAEPVPAPQLLRRCRIELIDRDGFAQPYHAAEKMPLAEAESFLESCSAASAALAQIAVRDALLKLRGYRLTGASVLLASGRPLPDLAAILRSHALIHTAEGEFYRAALRNSCESSHLRVTGIKERDLLAEASRALHRSPEDLQREIAGFGKIVGPPWRQDEKFCALAAWLLLAQRDR